MYVTVIYFYDFVGKYMRGDGWLDEPTAKGLKS